MHIGPLMHLYDYSASAPPLSLAVEISPLGWTANTVSPFFHLTSTCDALYYTHASIILKAGIIWSDLKVVELKHLQL